MARHCQNCDYHADVEFDESCLKPLLDPTEIERDYGAHVGNPGPWHNTLMRVNRIYLVVYVAFAVVAIIFFARMWLQASP